MSRRNQASVRDVLPDTKYNSKVVTKLINQIMLDGKRSIAQSIVYDALAICEEKLNTPAADVFNQALENVKPVLEVKARRVGGSTYQVPMEIRAARRQTLALRWIVDNARKRNERGMLNLQANLWTPITALAARLRRKKKFIEWLRLTRHSLLTSGKIRLTLLVCAFLGKFERWANLFAKPPKIGYN